MRKTSYAGLTVLDPGESLFTDGSSFTSRNPEIIDHYLRIGAQTHRHDGAPALGAPVVVPIVTTAGGGGSVPPNTTLLIGYTLLDAAGGETVVSPTALVTTASGVQAPTDPVSTEVLYDTGTLTVGTYAYAVTLVDSTGGETPAGPVASVLRAAGLPNARILISGLAELVTGTAGAARYRLYRAKNADKMALLYEGTADVIADDGTLDCDCCTFPPTTNTTSASNRLTITVPSNAIPSDAAGWRLYITADGAFTSPALYGPTRLQSEAGQAIVVTDLLLDDGAPPDVASTIAGAGKIDPDTDLLDWHWKRPVATVDDLSNDPSAANGDIRLVLGDGTLWIRQTGTWTLFSAPAKHWMPPVANAAALPSQGNTEGDVRLSVDDLRLHTFRNGGWVMAPEVTAGHTIAREGTALPARARLAFLGQGVFAYDDSAANRTVVSIPGVPDPGRAGHLIVDELAELPERDRLSFQGDGVSAYDDASGNRTIVRITGAGAGAGGPLGPLALNDTVEWQVDGAPAARLSVVEDSWTRSIIDTTFGQDGDPYDQGIYGDEWTITGGSLIPRTTGGGLPLANANAFAVLSANNNAHAAVDVTATFTLVNDGWNTLGVGLATRYGANGDPHLANATLWAVIDRTAGTMTVLWAPHGASQTTLAQVAGVSVPEIGDTFQLDLELTVAGDLAFTGSVITGAGGFRQFPTVSASTPVGALPNFPALIANWQTPDAFTVNSLQATEDLTTRRIVATTWSKGYTSPSSTAVVLSDSSQNPAATALGQASPGGREGSTLAADWTNPNDDARARLDSDLLGVTFGGRLVKATGTAPVAGELIAQLLDWSGSDQVIAVVTGDDDGRELGMVMVNATGELRWLDGRSTTPASKHPYVELSGVHLIR